ncbi:MAG: hypothetical protein EOM88_01320 [Clostridia bacterium]|jgi:hypothetical protein|nr:hypothetical protein [Clostridia bacterium]
MNFETPEVKKENPAQYENRIIEIRDSLKTEGYNKELDLEFVELWKNMPAGVANETHDNIDEIRALLTDLHPDKE